MATSEAQKIKAARKVRLAIAELQILIGDAENLGLDVQILTIETDVTTVSHIYPKIKQDFTAKISKRY